MIRRSRSRIARGLRARFRPPARVIVAALLIATVWASPTELARSDTTAGTYTNPLSIETTAAGPFESCPDPAIIRGRQPGDTFWYLYCTTNPLNDADRATNGRLNSHFLPMLRSRDVVHWEYVGDAFSQRPSWLAGFSGLWAPDIQFFNGRYYLYYTTNATQLPGRGSAIGVATSESPTGPWTDSGGPVVEPQPAPAGSRFGRWVYDPAVATDDAGQRYLVYGSFVGGISARRLSADGLQTEPASDVPVAAANRYEGVSIVRHADYYYLFASSGECCNGPLSGYSVLVGRSASILGPYTDREGVSLLAGQVGGTPVLSANGNRWIGPGHNTLFTDFAGQDWILYHAVERDDPYFAGTTTTKRPPLLDRLDWHDGWPVVHGGLGPSDTPQPAPAAQPGDAPRSALDFHQAQWPGWLDRARSVEFSALPSGAIGATLMSLSGPWQWVRPPATDTVSLIDGTLRFPTQTGGIEDHAAGILAEPEPPGEYAVETRVWLDVPPDGCCQNFVQAGLVVYGDDGNYLKLVHLSREQTRQVVFTKAIDPVPPRYPREGNTVVGPAGAWTYLRIEKRIRAGEGTYTAYSSRDGVAWTQGGAWTDALGRDARIGLVAMGGVGFTANFDYVRVYTLMPQ